MARIPKPTKIHVLDGTFRADRHNANEPEYRSGDDLLIPPIELSDEAQKIWDADAPKLLASGVLTEADVAMFADYCDCYARYKDVMVKMGKRYVVPGAMGTDIKNPLWSIAKELLNQINTMRRDFGMSPVSRTRIRVEKPKQGSKWDKFAASARKTV